MSAVEFNACDYLLDRHVREGRGHRLALTGPAGYTLSRETPVTDVLPWRVLEFERR